MKSILLFLLSTLLFGNLYAIESAQLTSPKSGTTISSNSVTFTWNDVGAKQYYLSVWL
jgi:hypothetical protein